MITFIIITLTVVLAIVLYIFLIAPRMINKPDMSSLYGYHYAHRGLFDNNSSAPENSIKAFKMAIDSGYGIELDVQLTKDHIPVVFHDATLERMCGINKRVGDFTFAELKQLKLAGSNETIPALKEALTFIDGQTPVIIEFKPYNTPAKLCQLVWPIMSAYKGIHCIESFHPLVLRWFKKHQPHIIRGQLCMEYWKEPAFKGQVLYVLLSFLVTNVIARPDFIAYKHSDANNISRRICRALGAPAFAWTIKSLKDYDNAKKHFDLFIFDSFRL